MRMTHLLAALSFLMIGGTAIVHAANETAPIMQYLGYTSLWQQHGGSLANGSNVPVSIAEALGSNIESGVTVGSGYYPNPADGRFAGKTITPTNSGTIPTSLSTSDHATTVGARFFGNDTGFSTRSVVPSVQSIQAYSFSEFNGSFLLNPGMPAPYGLPNNSRVASHAYGYGTNTIAAITRLDYLVQRDDFLQVVGATNWSTQGNTINSIVVVPANGNATKTAAVGTGTPYTAGRVSPDVTGPLVGAGSDSIGQVAGIVTLLVSRGKTTDSHHSYTTATTTAVTAPYSGTFTTYTKPGYTVTSGDTSEVVKAALMAGSLRNVAAYTNGALTVPGITNYRVDAANQSTNGLDFRYGAGMANAYNSYKIIDAGEKDSIEDGGLGQLGGSGIGQYGFDYDPSFGGANGSNSTATYNFQATANGEFFATLAWNVKINGGTTNFDSTATLYNLDLTLTDLTTNNVAWSSSTNENTENIWTNLIAGHSYALTATATGAPFEWDYGLAWRSAAPLTAVPEPGT